MTMYYRNFNFNKVRKYSDLEKKKAISFFLLFFFKKMLYLLRQIHFKCGKNPEKYIFFSNFSSNPFQANVINKEKKNKKTITKFFLFNTII